MKKKSKFVILVLIAVLVVAVTGVANATGILHFGFFGVTDKTEGSVDITPATYFEYEIEPTDTTIGGSNAVLYQDAEKLIVEYDGAEKAREYLIIVATKKIDTQEALDSDSIVYIDQKTADENGVKFVVFQSDLAENITYHIYISSNAVEGISSITEVGTYCYYPSKVSTTEARVSLIRKVINSITNQDNKNYDVNEDQFINESDIEDVRDQD